MRTDEPLANLQRRLGLRREAPSDVKDGCAKDGWDAAESEDAVEPSWVPDGLTRAHSSRGQHWLTVIRADPGRAGGSRSPAIGPQDRFHRFVPRNR
jgi:hypothetical protein